MISSLSWPGSWSTASTVRLPRLPRRAGLFYKEVQEKRDSGRYARGHRCRPADGRLGIANLLREAQLVSSNGEAFRMIKQGAVRIDGTRIEDRAP